MKTAIVYPSGYSYTVEQAKVLGRSAQSVVGADDLNRRTFGYAVLPKRHASDLTPH